MKNYETHLIVSLLLKLLVQMVIMNIQMVIMNIQMVSMNIRMVV